MKAYVFPGQGAQFTGMGKDIYDRSPAARELFEKANALLGFTITDLMFSGTDEDLRQTEVTQPAIFLHSTILAASLGEFSALVACKALSFDDGLLLVSKRAAAMQKACEASASTMAAIIGLDDSVVEKACAGIGATVVPANYNSPGQIVISGTIEGVEKAIELLKSLGAKMAVKLAVGGAFHSPLMEPARAELASAITGTFFNSPVCPVYQNVTGKPSTDPVMIKANLVSQLTSPVLWTQTVKNMISDGALSFTEVGPGNVLQGLIRKISREVRIDSASL